VKVLLENPDGELRPGMSVRAEVNTATHHQVTLVPIQSVVERPPTVEPNPEVAATTAAQDGDKKVAVVFVVEDGKASQREVETGISSTTQVEILRGVEPGEKVVVGPYRELRDLEDGHPVTLRKAEAETKAKTSGSGG